MTSSSHNVESAFATLHPGVQRQLWRMGWTHLRPLQVESIHTILQENHPIVISAATASGKTEAAFLPVLSSIADEPTGSVRALYIGPLRALINDQFSRLEQLCGYLDMPVHRWHGDVEAAHKKRLLKNPGGVLLLTPESLESLFVNRSPHLTDLFYGLRYVVIDELHAFLDNERGLHLQSLLSRLQNAVPQEQPFVRIGLSATLGNDATARLWMSPSDPKKVIFIRDNAYKGLSLRVHVYEEEPPDENAVTTAEHEIASDIWKHCAGHTNLVFANSRGDVEVYADLCNEISREKKSHELFLVHHGSLARDIRLDTEEQLKAERQVTAFCSSTLELGIDIGNVHLVGQIGAPWSVSSLKQRVGRSGRREEESRLLRIYLPSQKLQDDSDVIDRLQLPLLQTLAIVQLMLDGWIESSAASTCDLSTLTQQIISVISQTGGARAEDIYRLLCSHGAFSGIEPALFMRLLKRLGDREVDVIEQTPTGELILGLKGEKLRKSKDFYAVFPTPSEYALLHDGRNLGTLASALPPPAEEHLIFAGRRWLVVSVDLEKREIYVVPAQGKKRPSFVGLGGDISIQVRQKMQAILLGSEEFLYLDSTGLRLLKDARATGVAIGIGVNNFIKLGDKRTAWIPWCSSRTQHTLSLMLHKHGVTSRIKDAALLCDASLLKLEEVLLKIKSQSFEARDLASLAVDKKRRKYDWLLNDELLDEGLARGWIDLEGVRLALEKV